MYCPNALPIAVSELETIETDLRLMAKRMGERRALVHERYHGPTDDEITRERRLRRIAKLESQIKRHHDRILHCFMPNRKIEAFDGIYL